MIVKNEEKLIAYAINSVKPIVNEIIVVDTGSTDNTCKIALRLGAKVIHHKWQDSKGEARNVYLKEATGNWIIVLDADEKIAQKDLSKIRRLTENKETLGYILPRRDYTKRWDLLREWHPNKREYPEEERFSGCPGWSVASYIRLFRKNKGAYYEKKLSAHTDAIKFSKKSKGKIKECDVVIHHFQYVRGEEFVIRKQKGYLNKELNYIKTHRNDPWQYLNIGITFFNLKKDNLALKYLNKAVDIDKKFGLAYSILGMVYKERAEYAKAIINLKKAININPRHADAWAVLGIVYIDKGRLSQAEKALKKAIKICPHHLLAHNNLGIVYEYKGSLKEAEKEYKLVTKINPDFREAFDNLAALQKRNAIKEKNKSSQIV